MPVMCRARLRQIDVLGCEAFVLWTRAAEGIAQSKYIRKNWCDDLGPARNHEPGRGERGKVEDDKQPRFVRMRDS